MAAGAVQQACAAALAAGCAPDVDYHGEHVVDWTSKLGDPANPNPTIHAAFGYAAQMAVVDRETGKVERVVAVHDVGKAVNPQLCEGQIEGSVHMGLGYALTEDFPTDPGDRLPDVLDAAPARHPAGQGRPGDRGRARRGARSRGRRTASRASARSASCRPRRRSPPRCTTSTASGARPCR